MKSLLLVMSFLSLVHNAYLLDVVVSYNNTVMLNHFFAGNNASQAIQNASNAVRKAKGGTVVIKAGLYNLTRQITFYGNTTIKGEGMNDTILRLVNNASTFSRAGLLRSTFKDGNCNNISIESLTLDGNKQNQFNTTKGANYGRFGIFTEVCNDTLFDDVRITNFQGYGFDPHGMKPSSWAYNLTITNCLADKNEWDGFTLDQTIGIVCVNNTAKNNGRHGFNFVTGSRDIVITNVTTDQNGHYYPTVSTSNGCGITIQNNMEYDTHTAVVSFNSLIGDKRASLCIDDVRDITVFNNTMISAGTRCVFNKGSNDSILFNNICSNSRSVFLTNLSGYPSFNITVINNTIIPYISG
jgi:hypothetical protein